MFKITITLHSGSVAQVESADVAKLIEVLSSNLGVINSIEVINQYTAQKGGAASHNYSERKGETSGDAWSEKDILAIANKLIETGAKYGTIGDTVKYIKETGDQRRKEWVVYVMVNRVKQYIFDGRVRGSGLPRSAALVLQRNGIAAGSQAKTKGPKGKRTITPWSAHDITEIGKIIQQNLHLEKGLSNLVGEYVRKHGDVKVRTVPTLYSTTSAIKQYLTGENSTRLVPKMKRVLSAAGIHPVSQGTPVAIHRHNTLLEEA